MIRLLWFSAFQHAAPHCKQNNPQAVNNKYLAISSTYGEFLNEFLTSPRGVGGSFKPTRQELVCRFSYPDESAVQSAAWRTLP